MVPVKATSHHPFSTTCQSNYSGQALCQICCSCEQLRQIEIELQTIKTELTQIKSNIDALLGRLEQIAEQQKTPTEVRKKADGNKSEISQEDTASEADMNTEEPLNGEEEEEEEGLVQDDCDDELENSHFTYVEDSSLQFTSLYNTVRWFILVANFKNRWSVVCLAG
ncbi:hypothetical protein E2320_022785 [Naja naja]|nr:hypothetical protein E2320_022785 [Naja naja]